MKQEQGPFHHLLCGPAQDFAQGDVSMELPQSKGLKWLVETHARSSMMGIEQAKLSGQCESHVQPDTLRFAPLHTVPETQSCDGLQGNSVLQEGRGRGGDGGQGHSLSKGFPLSGYTEVRYDNSEERVIRGQLLPLTEDCIPVILVACGRITWMRRSLA